MESPALFRFTFVKGWKPLVACALGGFGSGSGQFAEGGLQLAALFVARLLVSLVRPGFLGYPAVHDGLLEAPQRGIDRLARLDDDLRQILTSFPVVVVKSSAHIIQ